MASLFDEAGSAKEFINKLTAIPGRQAYFLDVPGTESAKGLSVVEFQATEIMGAPTELRIVATHAQQLARADYLNLDAVFTIVPDDGVPKKISGFIERISNVNSQSTTMSWPIPVFLEIEFPKPISLRVWLPTLVAIASCPQPGSMAGCMPS
ncbi:hypothetical protein [Paraburkholderia oxyphila]|uniref:hypothetical protein n=1 Tax=Paraburkholderia oxyphila TaxID=614212 RepID=UPI00047F3C10|nr:hypothetical protein [Paraburkholderia oxyphila]